MDPAKLTKNESEANRVLEYYKKYSLNPDLNKYFTGPESFVKKRASDLRASDHDKAPEYVASKSNVELHNTNESSCVIEPSSCNSEENTQSAPSLDIEISQVVEIDEGEEKNNSRSSSAASNKIEWDNGADIGYSNSYKLSTKKSASFPSLFTSNVSVKCNVLPTVSQEKSITDNKEELRKMYHQLTFSSDTSNSSNKGYQLYLDSKEPSVESTSSSQENKNLKSSTQSSSSNNSVHRKIGNPVAYSTPHDGSSSKGSSSSGLISQKGTTSRSSDKFEGYTVTPMLTLPINKRKLNNNKPSELPKEQVVKECDSMGYKNNSPKKKAVPKMDQFQKKINLCLTKPISVECISVESKPIEHKDVQTSFSSDKSSKCVQTEGIELEDIVFKPVPICSPLVQKIEYVRFRSDVSKSDSDKSEARSDKKSVSEKFVPTKDSLIVHTENLVKSNENSLERNSKTTQTDLVSREKRSRSQKKIIESEENEKNVIRKASRTRMKTKKVDNSEVSSSVNSSRYNSDDRISTNGNVASTECGYKTADAVDEFQTEELLLTEMISLNHSKDLNTDIKRSIDILQKLLKSRKYDQATKKHYIKKIVQKIVDSKYSDDSTNSDLFRPKKSSTDHRFVQTGENKVPKMKGTSELMENKPWYPVAEPVYAMPKAKSKKPKSDKMAVEKKPDISQEQNNNFTYSNVIRNRTFRLPSQKENLEIPEATYTPTPTTSQKNNDQQPRNKKENLIEESPRFTSNSLSRLAYSTSLDKENRPTSSEGRNSGANWRTSKTLSEKILENRDSVDFRKGQGDYLLNVVKNERHHQLSWINNEIEHLVKLKQLLEKKPKDLKPESQLKDVISSLLKMKVDDMKGFPKNFEVLICKSEKTRKRCEPDCGRMKEFQRSRKKSASLTPDYYTIETKLDPDGNLVDLTVYDGNGKRKYNYRSDGVVDDVSISSKNHNTEVKLKPKVDDTSRQLTSTPHNVCRSCGRLFIQPASDTDVSLCEECFEDISNEKPKTSKDPSTYKICENCGMPFVPSKDNPNLCLCLRCNNEETQPEISSLTYSRTEECEACGRLFVRLDDNNSELCLCKDCESQLTEKDKSRRQSTKVCKVCGDNFQEYGQQDICEECLRFIETAEMKCACQKVTFSDPLELGVCQCVTKDSPLDKKEKEWKLKNVPTKIIRGRSSEIVKDISESGSKFFPKKPKLVGNEVDELDVSKGYPCTHCIGARESLSVKSRTSKYSVSNDIKQKKQTKIGPPHTSRSKGSNFGVDNSSKSRSKRNSSGSSISSRESPRPKLTQSKNDKCCKACVKCVGLSSTSSPRPGIIRNRSSSIPKKASSSIRSSSSPPRNITTRNLALKKNEESTQPSQLKKSCQCCTCVSCGIQTKKLGDKNVRCQCCVCTNCGIQVALDAKGKQQKTVNSKWCQQKRLEIQGNKNFPNDKSEQNSKELSKKKNSINRKRDELDHTDESLHSISSGNIVCITPTKYKNISNGKSDSECQCVILNSKTVPESDQHKPLQIRPSVLKFLCKSVNTYNTQERTAYTCPTKCPQGASGTSDSFVCIRIPRGIQCSDRDFDHESERSPKSFFPQICFFTPPSSNQPPPSPYRPPCVTPCRPPPCETSCRPPPCPSTPCSRSPPCRTTPCSPSPPPCRPSPCPPPCRPCPPSSCSSPCRPTPCPLPPPCPPPCRPSSCYSPPCSPPCRPCPPSPCPPPCRPSSCSTPPCLPPCKQTPCPPPPCPPPCRPSSCSTPPCLPPCKPTYCPPPPPCPPPCRPSSCSATPCWQSTCPPSPCRPSSGYAPPCSPPYRPFSPPCSPPCRPSFCSTPPCNPTPCPPSPCSPPCRPSSCSPPPCRPLSCPPAPCPPPCRSMACPPDPCSPPCTPPPCSPPCKTNSCVPPTCSSPCRPTTCPPTPCLPPCRSLPCPPSPCRPNSCPRPSPCLPLCTSFTQTCPTPCDAPPCQTPPYSRQVCSPPCRSSPQCPPPTCGQSPCPPPCRVSLSSCPPPSKPCNGPCSPPPCPTPSCRPQCEPQPCEVSPACTQRSPPKILCKPFPFGSQSQRSYKIVSAGSSNCYKGNSQGFFLENQPSEVPPDSISVPSAKAVTGGELQLSLIHVPCKSCGIPPCAAISSMICPICSQCNQKNTPTESTPSTKSNDTSDPNQNSSKYTYKGRGGSMQEDNSFTIPEEYDDVDSMEASSSSSSSTPSNSLPPDESRSCESLDYPCKPLKPKMADLRQNSSESSLTCPSKKAICPAKPPPCPGAGNKPCPAYPAKPCLKMKEQTGDESVVSPGEKSSKTYFTCPSKNAPCPAKPPPCPGSGNKPCPAFPAKPCPSLSKKNRDLDADNVQSRGSSRSRKICTNQNGEDFRYEKKEKRKSSRETDQILLPVSIKSTSPLQEVQNTGYETNQSKNSRKEPQTQDQLPPLSSNSPPNPVPFTDNHQDLQVFMCTTETRTNNKNISEQKCSCSLDMCKCNQTTTHEEKDVQCPASKQCQCQTEPKEDANVQCDCKALPERSSKKDKAKQNEENLCECKKSSSSSSSSDSQSDTESYMSCICCKKEKILKNLIKKIPLCEPCQKVSQKNFYPHSYTNPLHSCMCYKLVDCDILHQFKQTLTEIERLDIYQQYCEVLKNCKCCKECGCKCKLPKRFKNGCAYFLKLEDACPNTHCDEYESSDSSDYDEGEDDRGNDLPEVTVKVPNCRGSCARKKDNGQARETKKYKSCPSIQNYLCTMKPDFVERAERRRRILKDATSQREENSDKRKLKFIDRINYLNQKKRSERFSSEADIVKPGGYQTKAYCVFDIELNESPKRVRPRVFKSFKEMKDLTRRKYLHLNEVKSKKDIHREKRLREANRLLANTFTRRLQKSTLRGAVDIPLNVKVVSY